MRWLTYEYYCWVVHECVLSAIAMSSGDFLRSWACRLHYHDHGADVSGCSGDGDGDGYSDGDGDDDGDAVRPFVG